MALEKVVRPAQLDAVTPPKRAVSASEGAQEEAGFKAGLSGSGKSLSGSYSQTTTYYVDSHVNETLQL